MGFIQTERGDGGVLVVTMDDGAVNALRAERFLELGAAFDEGAEAPAVVIAGRPGFFSAGLDLKHLPTLDAAGLSDLLRVFGRTMMRIWTEPRPVVAAATGHAVAAGTILAMACDHAVAAAGDYRWGLNETSIGMLLPEFVLELAAANVRRDRMDDLLLPGRLMSPEAAVEAGFADEVAPPGEVVAAAARRAAELAQLPSATYALQKDRLRGPAARRVLDRLEADVTHFAATIELPPS